MNDKDRNIPVNIRHEVRRRDRNKCRKCGCKIGLEFHHIIEWGEVGRNTKWASIAHQKSNLILLCSECHRNAPSDPFSLFKYIKSFPLLPPNFSKAIELMSMGIPMLILRREKIYNEGYKLSVSSSDFKELIKDMEEYLRDLWEVQMTIGENYEEGTGWEGFNNLFRKYAPEQTAKNIDFLSINSSKSDINTDKKADSL